MNATSQDRSAALQRFEPSVQGVYPIETVVRITKLSRHHIAVYCRYGLITPISVPEYDGWVFDYKAIQTLRWMENLHTEYGVNMAGVQKLAVLLRELEQLREEKRRGVWAR